MKGCVFPQRWDLLWDPGPDSAKAKTSLGKV